MERRSSIEPLFFGTPDGSSLQTLTKVWCTGGRAVIPKKWNDVQKYIDMVKHIIYL